MNITAIGLVGNQGTNFQKRRTGVKQEIQAFADRQLFVFVQAINVALGAHMARLVETRAQLFNTLRHRCVVLAVALGAGIQTAINTAHFRFSSVRTRASTAPR